MIGLAHQEAVFSGSAKKAQQAIGMVAVEAVDMRHDIIFDVVDELRGKHSGQTLGKAGAERSNVHVTVDEIVTRHPEQVAEPPQIAFRHPGDF